MNENETLPFQALKAELETAGYRTDMSYTALSRSSYYNTWRGSVGEVVAFANKCCGKLLKTKTERLSFYRLLFGTLIKDLRRRSIPITVGTIAKNLTSIPEAFDRAFPNYRESGLAPLIVTAMLRR